MAEKGFIAHIIPFMEVLFYIDHCLMNDLTEMNVIRTNDVEATMLGLVFLLSDLKLENTNGNSEAFKPKLNKLLLVRFNNWKQEMENE